LPTIIRITTPEEYANQKELIAGRKILKINITSVGKEITVEDDELAEEVIETSEVELETLKRGKLNLIAEELNLNPEDYSNVKKICSAIREKVKADGLDLTNVVEAVIG
jgi:hypothetical protein